MLWDNLGWTQSIPAGSSGIALASNPLRYLNHSTRPSGRHDCTAQMHSKGHTESVIMIFQRDQS